MAAVEFEDQNLGDEFDGSDDGIEDDNMDTGIKFEKLTPHQMNAGRSDSRKVPVPPNRFSALKSQWMDIYTPIVEQLKLEIRMNTKSKHVELRTSKDTEDIAVIDRAVEFIRAVIIGFEISDAEALLRMEDLYIESFNVDDVKMIAGDHLSRAIGRIAGKDGKTKFTIENATRTRIVLNDKRVHILGSFQNIKVARDSICHLILGTPPGKVYAKLRTVSSRMKERF
jgi:RNA-binding protein PNO1